MVLVAPLLEIAVLLLTLALAALATIIVVSLFETLIRALSAVGLGGILTDWLRSIEQALTSGLGSIERGVDAAIGHSWHAFARLADLVWRDIREAAHSDLAIIESLVHMVGRVLHLSHLTHDLARARTGVSKQVKALEREYTHLRNREKALEAKVARGIGNDVRSDLRALEKEVTGIKDGVIPGLRAGIKTAEGEIADLENFIGAVPGTKYLAWAAGIVAAGLGLGVLNFFRCPTFLNKTLGRGCGFWNGIEDLLGLFVDTLLLTNICTLLPVLETAVSEVADPLVVALTDVGAGLCSGGIGAAPALAVPQLSLPASPGFTLNLP